MPHISLGAGVAIGSLVIALLGLLFRYFPPKRLKEDRKEVTPQIIAILEMLSELKTYVKNGGKTIMDDHRRLQAIQLSISEINAIIVSMEKRIEKIYEISLKAE